jgi:hypothetical protein
MSAFFSLCFYIRLADAVETESGHKQFKDGLTLLPVVLQFDKIGGTRFTDILQHV